MDKENQKILLRFFKEAGLYGKWTEYLKKDDIIGDFKDPTFRKSAEDFFNYTYFGRYLRDTYKIKMKQRFGPMFRVYLSVITKNKQNTNSSNPISSVSDELKIDGFTGNVKISFR